MDVIQSVDSAKDVALIFYCVFGCFYFSKALGWMK